MIPCIHVYASPTLVVTDLFYFIVNAAMIPELWLTEGGQSATGALLDHLVETHPAAPALANRAASKSEITFFPGSSEFCWGLLHPLVITKSWIN